MLLNPYRFFVSGGVSTYLDDLSPAPRVAYSLKKVVSTAIKSIRVRRSNDNAEVDIGFVGDALDVAALTSFAGSGSAFVTTFYDQTAAGINLVQATVAAQPRIVNAGVFDGALVFDGVNDTMRSAAGVPYGTSYAAAYTKVATLNQSAAGIILEASNNYNANLGAFIWYTENNFHSLGVNGRYSWRRDFSIPNISSLRTITVRYQMATADWTTQQHRFRAAGADISPAGSQGTPATPTVNFATNTLFLGSRGGISIYSSIQVETLVIYAANTDTSVAAIEAVVGA